MNSILTVTTAASEFDLTTLSVVRDEILGVGAADTTRNDQLELWITQASIAIANRCKRVFALETVSESIRRTGWALNEIILQRRPLNSIINILEDENTLASGFYEIDYGSGIVYKLNDDTAYTYRCGWNDADLIVVNYITGYDLPTAAPADLQRACVLLIKYFNSWSVSGGRGGDMNLRAIEIPGVIRREWGVSGFNNFNYNSNSMPDLPSDVLALIAPYIEKPI